MLGARARAAEYNAYKAATARQADREAEELKLPPKPVPVSLSAFTKNPLPNRNKGNKAWVPLILEDTPEPDENSSIHHDHDDVMSTPTRQTTRVFVESVEPRSRPLVPPVRELQPVRINIPDVSARVARKFNFPPQDYSAPLLNPTPRRIQPHSILQQTHQNLPPSIHGTPGNPALFSLYPTPSQLWLNGLQCFPDAGQLPFYPANFAFSHGDFMVPDDISPAKQENKLAVLSQTLKRRSSNFGPARQPFPGTPGLENNAIFPQYTSSQLGTGPPIWDLSEELTNEKQRHLHQSAFQHTNSDSLAPPDGEVFNSAPPPTNAMAQHISYSDGIPPSLGSQQAVQYNSDFITFQPEFLSANESKGEPYDRKSRMQNFVAAQQALAKTGKTVLHNPNLHRIKAEDDPTNAPNTETLDSPPEHDFHAEVQSTTTLHGSMPILKPPPGLEPQHAIRAIVPFDNWIDGATTPSHDEVRKGFDIGTPGWLELRPVTKVERTRMIKMMKLCSRIEDVDSPRVLTHNSSSTRLKSLYSAVEDKCPGNKKAREAVNQIANDYLASRFSQLTNNGGKISSSDSEIAKIESASIGAIGNILVNIRASSEMNGNEDDNVGYFCKYKPAPEYAIERGRLLSGNTGNSSYFEEETGGFYNAPSRIARDPRFRPASKEGLKGKVDDEWKHRHDLYGRRRL